jgi:hypothetical protein
MTFCLRMLDWCALADNFQLHVNVSNMWFLRSIHNKNYVVDVAYKLLSQGLENKISMSNVRYRNKIVPLMMSLFLKRFLHNMIPTKCNLFNLGF